MHAAKLAPFDRQVARHACTDCEHDRVVALAQLRDVEIDADVDAEAELDALLRELREAPLDDVLLDLEVRDAEPEQAAARLVALEDGHRVSRAVELLRAGEACGPAADDRDGLSGSRRRRLG